MFSEKPVLSRFSASALITQTQSFGEEFVNLYLFYLRVFLCVGCLVIKILNPGTQGHCIEMTETYKESQDFIRKFRVSEKV